MARVSLPPCAFPKNGQVIMTETQAGQMWICAQYMQTTDISGTPVATIVFILAQQIRSFGERVGRWNLERGIRTICDPPPLYRLCRLGFPLCIRNSAWGASRSARAAVL